MITLNELDLGSKKYTSNIFFGLAETKEEIEQVYNLRYSVYSKKEYIFSEKYPNKKETDEYDLNNQSIYFIARYNNEIFACIRLIRSNPLPTQVIYTFNEPLELINTPTQYKVELGRFIITKPNNLNLFFPRGIVLIFLFLTIMQYCKQNHYVGGYAFIKQSLEKKMSKLKIPFYKIIYHTKNINRQDVLYKYFTQKEDPVMPVFFLETQFSKYINKIIGNNFIILRKRDGLYKLRYIVYNILMKLLSY